jgi:uncharacterized repeat protein (TIGR03803 family)
MVSGCGGSGGAPLGPSATAVGAERVQVSSGYAVIYLFKGPPKGADGPAAGLTNVNGTFYGTTTGGGSRREGTVFRLTASGQETGLHGFAGAPNDGSAPQASLLNVKGTLYGTTQYGGAYKKGTVFTITTSGKETVLYSFRGGSRDGELPLGALLDVNGVLYGTTEAGGSVTSCGGGGCGTVFSITTSGREGVLYKFKANNDGQAPYAGLVNVGGTLYGTTNAGGAHCVSGVACGTVFSITTSGNERVLYSFEGAPTDGQNPQANLINVNGKLYGTTTGGGGGACGGGSQGCGTVFAITPSGTETVLHSFGNGSDGAVSQAALLDVNGMLYGTTVSGGQSGSYGTVFEISTSGKERVVHSFDGGSGAYPQSTLINVEDTLYGTAPLGGNANCFKGFDEGCGLVFSLKR